MAMKRGDIVFLDTNILLAATDAGRSVHHVAVGVFQDLPGEGVHLAVSGQVLREYLVVATRPVKNNGLGLALRDAIENIIEFRSRTIFLEENLDTSEGLVDLLSQTGTRGKRIHDMNIAATMISHRIRILMTFNPGDFTGIPVIEVRVPGGD
ncbi:MAG: hypothetical protein DRP60_09990 [Spirochaetes bacterium]|nr:MAG: hypothetical protein DRP60_09990 [Spirochaetota bacterium]